MSIGNRGQHKYIRELDEINKKIAQHESTMDKSADLRSIIKRIETWENSSIKKIQQTATSLKSQVQKLTEDVLSDSKKIITTVKSEIQTYRNNLHLSDFEKWNEKLDKLQNLKKDLINLEIADDQTTGIVGIKLKIASSEIERPTPVSSRPAGDRFSHASSSGHHAASSLGDSSFVSTDEQINYKPIILSLPSQNQRLTKLFTLLEGLSPMEKYGAMSGRCEKQTQQMENFLRQNFGFANTRESIVQGVKSFTLRQYPFDMLPANILEFPTKQLNSFKMTVREIIEWQKSYRVYSSKTLPGMNKEFLRRALQGLSQDGQEAFLMKFVIRISSCPILMEFDGKVIPREVDEGWVHNIKLVSVSGIDFAGRKHDVDDIRTYIQNWRNIYEVDTRHDFPRMRNERDFSLKSTYVQPIIHEQLLLDHLCLMAYLRLIACDRQRVQVVVETGIGLGVFAGREIGMEPIIQRISAVAFRTTLEKYGSNFEHISAIVFALPVFESRSSSKHTSCFTVFAQEFAKPTYQGPIPVLIADQDMHKLTVAIARQGFIVSELNPADSHGVFGEYWQNLGPAVEEKLALSTVGLLVQHHLINREVLNTSNYTFI